MIEPKLDEHQKTLTLCFPGDLLSSNADEARKEIDEFMEKPETQNADWNQLILDLRQAKLVDSVGLNLIVSLIKRMKLRDGKVKSLISSRTVYRTSLATRLDKEMEIDFSIEPAKD